MQFILDGITNALTAIVTLDIEVYSAAWRSLWISTLAVLLASFLGIPLGTWLARRPHFSTRIIVQICQTGMALPTVFIGLICFAMFARSGPLGPLDLLYTPWAIVIGEVLLAFPLIVSHTHGAVSSLDNRIGETALTLGASPVRRFLTYLSEARVGIKLAIFTAFSRCVTELGIAMMVGGNLKDQTRTLSTATALETSKGEFSTGMAMGFVLLLIAFTVTLLIQFIGKTDNA